MSEPSWITHPDARRDLVESAAEDRVTARDDDRDGWAADRAADREVDAYWRRFN